MTTLTDYQKRTLSNLTYGQTPVLVFIPLKLESGKEAYERQKANGRELDELVAEGLLMDDSESVLKENMLARGFKAYTLTDRAFALFADESTVTQ